MIGIRSLSEEVRTKLQERLVALVTAQAESFGVTANVDIIRWYGPTVNHERETNILVDLARKVCGEENVIELDRAIMGSEDFSFMLHERPGCYFFMGGGTGIDDYSPHHPKYDFNDDIIPQGASLWTHLVETYLPTKL